MLTATATKVHSSASTSYSTIAKAVNAQVAKSVVEGKQVKIRFSLINIYHAENCRDVFDAKGQLHVAAGLKALKNNQPLKNLTVTAIKFEDGTKGVKVVDGFHTFEIMRQFVNYLKSENIEKVKIGNVTFTNSMDTTFLPVDILELNAYQQDLYKLSSQRNRKNDPIELITFIDRMMTEHNKTLAEIATEINKPQSTLKNLLILLNADQELIDLVKSGEIKASRAATLMRSTLKQKGIDGRRKDVDLKKVDFSAVTKLAQKEIELYNSNNQAALADNGSTDIKTDAPRPRNVTRQSLKATTLKPSEITNIENLITLLAGRETTIEGDTATLTMHTAILEEIQLAAQKIKEKNEYNNNLLSV